MSSILLANADTTASAELGAILEKEIEGLVVQTANSGEATVELLRNPCLNIALVEYQLPDMDGLEVLRHLKQKGTDADVVLLTNCGNIVLVSQAMKLGARDFFIKPVSVPAVLATIENLIANRYPIVHPLTKLMDTYLQQHYTDTDLNMEVLCQHFRISTSYVTALFRKYLHTSFRRQVQHYRVEKAKELLRETDGSIRHIAQECGYRDYRRLTEAFQREVGIPPRLYRRNSPLAPVESEKT